jgi:hypothetical protein
MNWQISKLTVDVNTDQANIVLESMPYRNPSLTLNFSMPETLKLKPSAAQTLDNVSRAALIAQAKKVLIDAANSLAG